MREFLLTGASGHIGEAVLKNLHLVDGIRLHCPLRPSTFERLSNKLKEKYPSVQFFACELSDIDLIEYMEKKSFEGIIHVAGLYDLDAKNGDLYLSNVVASMGLVNVCNRLKISRFLHISTVAVAGSMKSELKESPLKNKDKFYNEYERTKYMAENFVTNSLHPDCSLTVIRPGIVLGSSDPSIEIKLDGPYFVINYINQFKNILRNLFFLYFPYNPTSVMPFCNVDMVSQTICSWVVEKREYAQYYNIVFNNNPNAQLFLKELLAAFDIRLKLIPTRKIAVLKKILPYVKIPANLYDYLFYGPTISNELFQRDFSTIATNYEDYFDSFINNYKAQNKGPVGE